MKELSWVFTYSENKVFLFDGKQFPIQNLYSYFLLSSKLNNRFASNLQFYNIEFIALRCIVSQICLFPFQSEGLNVKVNCPFYTEVFCIIKNLLQINYLKNQNF